MLSRHPNRDCLAAERKHSNADRINQLTPARQQARYEAEGVRCQYDSVEPEDRIVASPTPSTVVRESDSSIRHSQPENRKKHILGSCYATARKCAVESIKRSQRSHLLG
jgi:hypothetical protein